jgi:hypothetical protein
VFLFSGQSTLVTISLGRKVEIEKKYAPVNANYTYLFDNSSLDTYGG